MPKTPIRQFKNNGCTMTVFISWAGTFGDEVALGLRDWLLCILQSVTPYLPAEDVHGALSSAWTLLANSRPRITASFTLHELIKARLECTSRWPVSRRSAQGRGSGSPRHNPP